MVGLAWAVVAIIASIIVAEVHYRVSDESQTPPSTPPDKCDECRRKKAFYNGLPAAIQVAYGPSIIYWRTYCRNIGCRWRDI